MPVEASLAPKEDKETSEIGSQQLKMEGESLGAKFRVSRKWFAFVTTIVAMRPSESSSVRYVVGKAIGSTTVSSFLAETAVEKRSALTVGS